MCLNKLPFPAKTEDDCTMDMLNNRERYVDLFKKRVCKGWWIMTGSDSKTGRICEKVSFSSKKVCVSCSYVFFNVEYLSSSDKINFKARIFHFFSLLSWYRKSNMNFGDFVQRASENKDLFLDNASFQISLRYFESFTWSNS